ncbi:MAG: class I SAM-dependent methyltransferase [Alphaproteobacteria bacterium]|nr:class I SAM-dependent methyltransferase [Alphaproteobacteria bacterium]MCW5744202.1 class I SAM-dependent methyltransferase [Alphaproteobacteria bacterium]
MPTLKPLPPRDELMDRIRASGSGDLEHFGYPVREDGLYLQQDPAEFADFVSYMATQAQSSELSLDIGVAGGGQTVFLREYYGCAATITVDLGAHPDAHHWKRIKQSLNSQHVLEIIDDSHSTRVRELLRPYKGTVDFAFVDGDHSYRGLRKDVFLVRELLKPGALMALHDTVEVPDCKRVHDEMLRSRVFEHVKDFNSRFGISLWRLKQPVDSTWLNRIGGFGQL